MPTEDVVLLEATLPSSTHDTNPAISLEADYHRTGGNSGTWFEIELEPESQLEPELGILIESQRVAKA